MWSRSTKQRRAAMRRRASVRLQSAILPSLRWFIRSAVAEDADAMMRSLHNALMDNLHSEVSAPLLRTAEEQNALYDPPLRPDALRPIPALPLYVTHIDPDGRIHATTTPPKEQDWQLVTDAEPFRYLDTPLPARTWRGTIAVPPKEPK